MNQKKIAIAEEKHLLDPKKLMQDCRVLLDYAIGEGLALEADRLDIIQGEGDMTTHTASIEQLVQAYNYLIGIVHPVNTKTILILAKNKESHPIMRMLGPLPIIRQFMVVGIISLITMLTISISSHLNIKTINFSLLEDDGRDQAYRLIFLIACSGVGASFYSLFKISKYLSRNTFDVSYGYSYWIRFILGIVAGVLLSELLIDFLGVNEVQEGKSVQPLDSNYLLKPVLAILGGFSADLVYRILNKLVDTFESIFSGDVDEMIAQKLFQSQLRSDERSIQLRNTTAQRLLTIKQTLVGANAPEEVIQQLDNSITEISRTNSMQQNKVEKKPIISIKNP